MNVVAQGGERTRVGDAVYVKWLPRFLKYLNQFGPRDAVADAQTGESMNFREGAQDNDIPALASELQRLRRTVQEFKIGLVKTTMIFSGTRDMKPSILRCGTNVPVGLLGLGMKISRVFGVIASSIASRSW